MARSLARQAPLGEQALAALPFAKYVEALRACRRCASVEAPPVVGAVRGARMLLVGQAPGPRERDSGTPFVWTAGTTLFRWFASIGAEEQAFRKRVYMAAVIRCFPGRNPERNGKAAGDRAPSRTEIDACRPYLLAELRRLRPALVIPVGRPAIEAFLPHKKLDEVVGRAVPLTLEALGGHPCTAVPLPHPSGLSSWHKTEPGRTLLQRALGLIAAQPVWREAFGPR